MTTIPLWLRAILALLLLGIAGYAVSRSLSSGAAGHRASGLGHLVMSLAMAAVLVPTADPLPRPVWITAFVLLAGWFAADLLRNGVTDGWAAVHHLVGAIAMISMYTAMSDSSTDMADMPGMDMSGGGAGLIGTVVAAGALLYFLGDAAWSGRQAVRGPARSAGVIRLTMSAAMAAMVVAMW